MTSLNFTISERLVFPAFGMNDYPHIQCMYVYIINEVQ